MKLRALVVFALLLPGPVRAQPVLTFSRIVNNWPTIEVYFQVTCNGEKRYPDNKSNWEIFENGTQMKDFTLWCPDPRQRCGTSAVLVFDASASMQGQPRLDAIEGGTRFVKLMDGIIDESAVVWARSIPVVRQLMTKIVPDLLDAINELPASGGAAIWDAIYTATQELIMTGSNPCRAVIVFTDGKDNGSAHTPDEIIALANRNRLRVFTVGYGDVAPMNLQMIAELTGGQYYQNPTSSQIVQIYEEISTIIFGGFLECLFTYQASCQDGTVRTVDVTLHDYCNGSDTKSRSYRAPKDTSTHSSPSLVLRDTDAFRAAEVLVPFDLIGPPIGSGNLGTEVGPFSFTVRYPIDTLEFLGAETGLGTLFNRVQTTAAAIPGGARVTVLDRRRVRAPGTLMHLKFRILPIVESGDIDIRVDSMEFEGGCWKPTEAGGRITVIGDDVPVIVAESGTRICHGDSVTLRSREGFKNFLWSTGDTTESITVGAAGTYTLEAENASGMRGMSPPVTVEVIALPQPFLTQSAPGLCEETEVRISAPNGYTAYLWSTGATGMGIAVTDTGRYFCDVRNEYGCWGRSDTVTIKQGNVPVTAITGPIDVCSSDSAQTYSAAFHPESRYSWAAENGIILTPADSHEVRVRWNNTERGVLSLTETDTVSMCTNRAALDITIYDVSPHLYSYAFTQICPGGETSLMVKEGYDSYLWNTGDTTNTLVVTLPGWYWCELTKGRCTGTTDTVEITQIPAIEPHISGSNVVCENDTAEYTITNYDTDYDWSVLHGSVAGSRWGNSIRIVWQDVLADTLVCRVQVGGCVAWDTLHVTVTPAVNPDIEALGAKEFCEGDSVTLEAQPGFSSYKWSNGAEGRRITVKSSGSFSVSAVDTNGCTGYSQSISVGVHGVPDIPEIKHEGTKLRLSYTYSDVKYSWYRNGVLIADSAREVEASIDGVYTVVATIPFGCTKTSGPIVISAIGAYAPSLARSFTIAPNPTTGAFEVALEFDAPTAFSMHIVNTLGQTVYSEAVGEERVSFRQSIALDAAPPGVYFFILESKARYNYRKLVVQGD